MADDVIKKEVTEKYCRRFGMIAVAKGFVTADALRAAIDLQLQEDLAGKPHRLIGSILFDQGLMTGDQIDAVLNTLFDREKSG